MANSISDEILKRNSRTADKGAPHIDDRAYEKRSELSDVSAAILGRNAEPWNEYSAAMERENERIRRFNMDMQLAKNSLIATTPEGKPEPGLTGANLAGAVMSPFTPPANEFEKTRLENNRKAAKAAAAEAQRKYIEDMIAHGAPEIHIFGRPTGKIWNTRGVDEKYAQQRLSQLQAEIDAINKRYTPNEGITPKPLPSGNEIKESYAAAQRLGQSYGIPTIAIPGNATQRYMEEADRRNQDRGFAQRQIISGFDRINNYISQLASGGLTVIDAYSGGRLGENSSLFQLASGVSSAYGGAAQASMQSIKENSTWLENLIMELEGTGIEQLMDFAIGGGQGLLPMAMRTFGAGAEEGRREGRDIWGQIGTGAIRGGIEVGTELLGGVGGSWRGTGYGDAVFTALDKWVAGKTGSELLGTLASAFGSEGVEEMLADILNPLADRIFNISDGDQTFWNEVWGDGQLLYDGLLGGLAGMGGGAVGHAGLSMQAKRLGVDITTYKAAQRIAGNSKLKKKFEGYTGTELSEDEAEAVTQAAIIITAYSDGNTGARTIEKEAGNFNINQKAEISANGELEAAIKDLGLTGEAAQIIREGLELGSADEAVYTKGIIDAFNMGAAGVTEAEMLNRITYARQLTAIQRKHAYELGKTDNTVKTESAENKKALEQFAARFDNPEAVKAAYREGQDAGRFSLAFEAAYNMGRAGIRPEAAMDNDVTAFLDTDQRRIAFKEGRAAAKGAAADMQAAIVPNGKSGRKYGKVSGQGVSLKELRKEFNDPQNKAYKILTTIANLTGIDIVLYKSEPTEDGRFKAAQGKFKRSENKIYIDVNAGLYYAHDVNELSKYSILRTFSHEFTHFIEKWSPEQYDELRKLVFKELDSHGENAHDLIELRMTAYKGMDYEQASREVVAESMTDILPDSHFIETLANEHQTIFQKLREQLKEFIAQIKAYYARLVKNPSPEARGLQEAVGETTRYLDSIIEMFDKAAVSAVENYQTANATNDGKEAKIKTVEAEAAENTQKKAATEVMAQNEAEITDKDEEGPADVQNENEINKDAAHVDGHGITITDNPQYGSIEIGFSEKPSEAVRNVLKENKFRWNRKKLVWYGKAERESIRAALHEAMEAERPEASPRPETMAEKPENTAEKGTDKNDSTKTENIIKEETHNVENADNSEAVQQLAGDRQGNARLLDELEAENVSGDVQGRNSVGDPSDGERQAVRNGRGADSRPVTPGTGSGNGDSESRVSGSGELKAEVETRIERVSTEKPRGQSFVIGDSLELPSGDKSKFKANVDAIRLLKQLEAEDRCATAEEQKILSRYVGWGALANAFDERKSDWAKEYSELKELLTKEEYEAARASTLNAHYTDIQVIKAMYEGLEQLGFKGGRMLEPASGVGNFVGAMPESMSARVKSWTMVELDSVTGRIARYLYPYADVRVQGFEKANIPDNFMDVAISNVPFGDFPIADRKYPKRITSAIHNYFFAKALDKVRPGGIVMFITSRFTMDGTDTAVRKYISERADLLGAIRLPDTAFKGNAGTDVVADIIILKKRAPGTEYAGEDFQNVNYVYEGGTSTHINTYFHAHPEMVLGQMQAGGRYYGETTYKAYTDRGSLREQINKAFENIKGEMEYPKAPSPEKLNKAAEQAGKKTKNNAFISKDGKIYRNENGEPVEQKLSSRDAERISGLLGIRDALRELQNSLQQGMSAETVKKARKALNDRYDRYVKLNGFLNNAANKAAFKDEPDSYSLLALENWDAETKKATKADIFTKDTIAANVTISTAKDVTEGLIISRNRTGGVDVPLIARLTGESEEAVTRELIDTRQAFKNAEGALEPAEAYLSGNVRAKLRDAEALLPFDKDYQANVEALKEIVPKDIPYQDIFINPGTPWLPASIYSEFAAHILGGRAEDSVVKRNVETGNFTVDIKNAWLNYCAANTQKWGTQRRPFTELYNALLNSKSVVVRRKDSEGKSVVDKDATAAANEKIEEIKEEFQDWIWKDEARREELPKLYNETFNAIVTPKYNGEHLTVNGTNAMKPLRKHQRDAVQRIISSGGNTLLAHRVGAGKTYEMAAAAMKLKELGLVNKPMFAVPKALVAQWGKEFKDFFPTARLLVAENSDFSPANRRIYMNRIANGSYDAVIVSYEQFEKLPVSDEFTMNLYKEQIDEVIAAIEEAKAEGGDSRSLSVKDLEKKRKALEAKLEKLTSKPKDEDNISFEQLGVDALFVDEAHNFKNLFYTTSMSNVSGLGNKDGSQRAFDLFTKIRYLQQLNGGKGIVFATATPVMNSMSEMYIMQKYLQPDTLKQLGIYNFDAWAKQFGEVVNGVEIKPSGQGFRVKQSFSKFKNLPELQMLFRSFADVLTDIPDLKIPKMKGGKVNIVQCEPGKFQKEYMEELEKRAENIKNVDPSVDNMLKITSDGKKVSYTQRMIDPSMPYEEGNKIFKCADNVLRLYKESAENKGTQLVFLDAGVPKGDTKASEEMDMDKAALYEDLKARLVKGGIPAREIAFIHSADTDAKKKKLFSDMNEGKVRVLIGSTGKMGVGMNAQKRVAAIHHLDAPYRPGDIEQRDGRAFRQGNINDEVEKLVYVTEGSFDTRLWDILDRKQGFINQIMNGDSVGRDAEDTGEVTLSAAEVKALASGNPLIMEQVQLDTDIKRLESLKRAHSSEISNASRRLQEDMTIISGLEKRIEAGEEDLKARTSSYQDNRFSIKLGKKSFTDKKEAGAELLLEIENKATAEGYTDIGSFAGFTIKAVKTSEGYKGLLFGKKGYPFNIYTNAPTRGMSHLMSVVSGMEEELADNKKLLAATKADLQEQLELSRKPFTHQSELDEKRKRFNEVMEILNPKEEQSMGELEEQEESRELLNDDEEKNIEDALYPLLKDRKGVKWNKGNSFSKSEYAAVVSRISTEYHYSNKLHDGIQFIDRSTDGKNAKHYLYLFKDNGFDKYEILCRINYSGNEERIKTIREIVRHEYRNEEIHNAVSEMRDYGTGNYSDNDYNNGRALNEGNVQTISSRARQGREDQGQLSSSNLSRHEEGSGESDLEQKQQRVKSYSDREVPEQAAEKVIAEDMTQTAIKKETASSHDARQQNNKVLSEQPNYEGITASDYNISGDTDKVNTLDAKGFDEQNQARTKSFSDTEVLQLAAKDMEVEDFSEAEVNALNTFTDRLEKLEQLQSQRKELGTLYKEQQFGKKSNREEAQKTRNRMQILDNKIKEASAAVLKVEESEVMKRVLKQARKVVEKNEREKSGEKLARYRDRRYNYENIKKYRARIKADVDELTRWALTPGNKNALKHMPEAIKQTVLPFLMEINFESKRSLKGGAKTKNDFELMDRLYRVKEALKKNREIRGLYSGYNDLPPEFQDRLDGFIAAAERLTNEMKADEETGYAINLMTADELKDLSIITKNLKQLIMNMNRFHANAMFKHVYDAGDDSIEFLARLKPRRNADKAYNFLFWQQMRPAYAFERFGKGGMAIYDGLRRGQAALARNTKAITDFAEAAYTAEEVQTWEKETKVFDLGGQAVTIPVANIMALYELRKRPQALQHLVGRGFRVATWTDKSGKHADNREEYAPSLNELDAIIDSLTPRQKEVADKLQQFMAKQGGEWGNLVSVARFGEQLFGEKNYFPINSDGRHLPADADEKPSDTSLYALLNMSFTKQLNEQANNRLVLYSIFDVFANHMASMAQYNAMALPVLDALKWFNYRQISYDERGNIEYGSSVREEMARAFGAPDEEEPGSGRRGYAEKFVMGIIKAFNGTEAQGTPADTAGVNALHRFNMAQVAYNLRVVVQQPLSILRAASVISYNAIMKGLKASPAQIKANIEEMNKYSGIALWKALGFYDVNISRGVSSLIKHDSSLMDKIGDVGMKGAEIADTVTWAAMWSACKEEVSRKTKTEKGSKAYFEEVNQLFEDVIYKTQVVDSVLTKNEFLRAKGFSARAISSFMAEPTTTASMLLDAYDKYQMDIQRSGSKAHAWQKNRNNILRTIQVYSISAIALAAAEAVIDGWRDDDDYMSFYEKWLDAFKGNAIDELIPLNKIPGLNAAYEAAKALLAAAGADVYGHEQAPIMMRWLKPLTQSTEILHDKITGEKTGYTWYGGIYKLLQAAAGLTGLPIAAATREAVSIWNNTIGAFSPRMKLKSYRSSDYSEIRYAYKDGYLTDKEATKLLIDKGLVKNEDGAYWEIKSWEGDGENSSKYSGLYAAARAGKSIESAMRELTEHGVTKKDALSALKSQTGKWYRDKEIDRSTVNSILTKYLGMDREAVADVLNEWSVERDTGISYNNIDDAYISGDITGTEAVRIWEKYGGMTRDEAEELLKVYDFKASHPELSWDNGTIRKYLNTLHGSGITPSEFDEYRRLAKDCKGTDADGDGIADRNSVKAQKLAIIDAMPLSPEQKDALYRSEGSWSEAMLYKAPWH